MSISSKNLINIDNFRIRYLVTVILNVNIIVLVKYLSMNVWIGLIIRRGHGTQILTCDC